MAKGNIFIGTARGKLGDNVLYRSGGEQRSRIRVTPKNPRSAKQAVQRMVLATAAKLAAAYEPIVNHSFEGVTEGAKSVQLFRKYAMNALRSAAVVYLNDPSAVERAASFAMKGAPVIGAMDGLQVSQGKLSINGYSVGDGKVSMVLKSALSSAAITTQAGYITELAKLGIEPGDQLTYVVECCNFDDPVASAQIDGVTYNNYAQQVRFCRVVFKSVIPDEFSGTLISGGSINPALIEESYGALPAFSETTNTGGQHLLTANFADVLPMGYELILGGIIRSQKVDGAFKYSSCFLGCDTSLMDENNANDMYPTYMDGVAEVNVGSQLYLQHAVAAPFAAGE